MSLTELQRRVSRIVAEQRREPTGSYMAGGVALNEALGTKRVSRDLDLFHDTTEAVHVSAERDQHAFRSAGLAIEPQKEAQGFVQVLVRDSVDRVLVEWVRDSAYRFFPLQPDDTFGLTLHPMDLATNKVLALVGRVEVRDWVDIIACHARLQPLGYLAWAATGKDPGLGPAFILEEASRTARYSADEVAELVFEGPSPSAVELSHAWRAALCEARAIVDELPPQSFGRCVLDATGAPFRGDLSSLKSELTSGRLTFHAGRIGGALPTVRPYLEQLP